MDETLARIAAELPVVALFVLAIAVVGKRFFKLLEDRDSAYRETLQRLLDTSESQRSQDREAFQSTIEKLIENSTTFLERIVASQKEGTDKLSERIQGLEGKIDDMKDKVGEVKESLVAMAAKIPTP